VERGQALVRLFCRPEEFGRLRGVRPEEVPQPARQLLDHRSHMTVTMERFHGTEVRLRIVGRAVDQPEAGDAAAWYAREILLESPSGQVLQHGIVRIDLKSVDVRTAREIREGVRPLGRVLIDAGVLRDVHSVQLLEIIPGPHLAGLIGRPRDASAPVYGRVADILLNGRPAVELLEIVAPTG
jgi:chorismate-pyruvate lyase